MRLRSVVSLPWREWAPAALVSALVLVGGARLIVLSTQQQIADRREATADAADRTVSRIEAELEALAERARRETKRAVDVLGPSGLPEGLGSIAPDEDGFWTGSDGSIVPAAYPTDAAAARDALAREWRAGDGDPGSTGTEWLAPLRHGSQWLVAARAPILLSDGNDVGHAGWSVVYQPLEEMLLRAGIDELPQEGYALALGQRAPGSDALRVLLGSPFGASPDDLTRTIRRPDASRATDSSEPYMVLALRPSAGWYSPATITANVGLLLVLTWLLGLAAYDLLQSQNRWRAALALARQRLVATKRRLTEELEENRLLQLSFEHVRFHDTFTGMPNRRYFMNQLDQALRGARGGRGQLLAVILVDIDRFKLVNDTLGQAAGDELMVQVARRFENKIGTDVDPGYVLARWSGDQFALLLFDMHSSATAVTFAKLIGQALEHPFILRRHTLSVAAHIGITCIDTALQRTEDVVREADIALSVAKRREATDPVIYEAALGADVVSTVSLEADLHVALEREQFRLLFQPIVDLTAGTVVGAEALLRWSHPVEGLLAPDRFLPIAEDARLIVPISRWVIRRACKLGAEWRRHVRPDTRFYVSVNLTATVLDDPHLVRYVAAVLQETGLPAASLRFELTEGDLTPHVGAAREVLDAFRDMGIGLVLDDFGTGRSSLSYLELFPIDCVKIDRPFINAADGSDSEVMRCVVQMASSLGLEAVAEKVETETAVQALKRMGCKYGQGYLLGEPVESEHLLARLEGRIPIPAPQDAPMRAQPALSDPAAPEAPTLNQVGPAAVSPADAQTRVAPPPDTPTLVLPRLRQRAPPDAPTLVLPGPRERAPPETPTLVLPTPSERVPPDAPTLVQPASSEPVAPGDAPAVALRERPGAAAPDEPTVEVPGASDPTALDAPTLNEAGPAAVTPVHAETRVAPSAPDTPTLVLLTPPDAPTLVQPALSEPAAADAPTVNETGLLNEAPTVEHPVAALGDEASDGDEPTTRVGTPAEAFEDDSPTQRRFGRRWLRHARGN